MFKALARTGLLGIVVALAGAPVHALPSFSRQTRLACDSCHTSFPQLTAFGRDFKVNGYTMTSLETIDAEAAPARKGSRAGRTTLKLLPIAPVSAMLQTSYNRTAKALPGTQNDDVEFPQQLSVFLAGAMSPHLGAFIQVTYDDQGASFGWDNADIRYARQARLGGKSADWGVTLNNNPTVQDLWNSTPAWGFPYASSAVAPAPSAATLIEGGLAQQVAGLGAYVLYDDLAYVELSLYRSTQQGGPQPPSASSLDTIKGVAPYWRLAFQHQWAKQYLMVGTYGMRAEIYPIGVTGLTDRYTDFALDVQYERKPRGSLTVHGSWIHESQDLDATFTAGGSQNRSGSLRSVRLDTSYAMANGLEFSAGYFSASGDSDNVLYGPAEVTGSRTGSPDSSGVIAQVGYSPWLNTRFAAQYVFYDKFNGAKSDYDGFGRGASDNDTLYAFAWFVF